MALETYQKKRDFAKTPEPRARLAKKKQQRFVVQEHHASRLHYDFRLEMGGVLKSWAVPKGPSLDPKQKRLAVQVEDHPVSYLNFQGEIAEGNYGAGRVFSWDIGTYQMAGSQDPLAAYAEGRLSFILFGRKLRGQFNLIRMKNRKNQWLLIKSADEFAQRGWKLEPILKEAPTATRAAKSSRAKRAGTAERHTPKRSKRPSSEAPKSSSASLTLSEFVESKVLRGDVQVRVDDAVVLLTHMDKLYWPKEGITKGDLLRYYARVAPTIVPYLRDRPLILKRYPNGIEGPFFFQHDLEDAPDFVRTQSLKSAEGRPIDYAIIDNPAALLYLTNLGTIEEHPWHSRVQEIEYPDWVVFDLDPQEAPFEVVCEVAQALRETLEPLGLQAYAKTSGSRGIHVLVPIEPRYGYDQVADFAEQVANQVAREHPKSATVVRSLSRRQPGLVYVDYLQNAKGKSIAAPYSVRARPGATVSAPLEWKEVRKGLAPQEFTLKDMPARLRDKGDLFSGVLAHPQRLDEALAQSQDELGPLPKPPSIRTRHRGGSGLKRLWASNSICQVWSAVSSSVRCATVV
jgi:bifunctional non-homologous end joining protein LigD